MNIPAKMAPGPRITWRTWIGIALSLVCLALALQGVQWQTLVGAVRHVSVVWLGLALVTSVANLLAKAARWQVLFISERRLPLPQAYSRLIIGMLLNLFTPARLGDLARAYLIGETGVSSASFALGTILFEKVLDLLALLVAVLILLTRLALPSWLIDPTIAVAIALALAIPGMVLLLSRSADWINWVDRVAGRLKIPGRAWFLHQLRLALGCLQILHNPRLILTSLLWTLLVWGLAFLTNLFVFLAVGLPASILPALFVLAVLQAGVAVPSSPGRIGVFQYLVVLSLAFFQIGQTPALVGSLFLYLVVFLPILISGGISFAQDRSLLRRLALVRGHPNLDNQF